MMMDNEQLFQKKLNAIGKDTCPKCNKLVTKDDVAWMNDENDEGEPFSELNIECSSCHKEILSVQSWYTIDDFDYLVGNFEDYMNGV